jgi:hypothetical protein
MEGGRDGGREAVRDSKGDKEGGIEGGRDSRGGREGERERASGRDQTCEKLMDTTNLHHESWRKHKVEFPMSLTTWCERLTRTRRCM